MAVGARVSRTCATFLVALALVACSAPGPAAEQAGPSGPSPLPPSTVQPPTGTVDGPGMSPSGTVDGPGMSPFGPETAGPAAAGPLVSDSQPLVIAVHHTSRLRDVSLARAQRIVDGRSALDIAKGLPHKAIRSVVRTPGTVAVVPAGALGPEVRALSVGGIDPLRRPAAYPLRTRAAGPRPEVVTVSVVGDIMLGRGVAAAARGSGDPALALRPTAQRLAAADITVGNLESTLSRAGAPRQGDDSFAADPLVVQGILDSGFDVLGLANNHAGDFGDRALVRTVRRLRASGLGTFGAGRTVRQAWDPAVVERAGISFGFIGFNAIGETPAVAPGQPGAVSVGMPPRTGPLDRAALRRFETAVRRLAAAVDVVVVMPHWGTQYTNRPEPIQRVVARGLVAAGADAVVGGHPHWLQGVEMVRGRLVAHSLGNFVFDMDFMRETQQGAILEMTFWGDELKAAELVPYVMDDRFAPRVVTGRRAEEVLAVMRETSGPAHRRPD